MKLLSNRRNGRIEFQLWRIVHFLRCKLYPCNVAKTLEDSVRYIQLSCVKGDVAEFGCCMTARSARILYYSLKRTGRTLHLFDSFNGMPDSINQIDTSCPMFLQGIWREGVHAGISADWMQKVCPRAIIHEGLFDTSIKILNPNITFGLIHVDCNLYQSTIDSLYYLFDRNQISKGAMILFDDWNNNQSGNSFGERRAWSDLCEMFNVDFESFGMYGITGHRLIVHSYGKIF